MKINDGSPFSKRLKEVRTAKGFSQKQLGIQAGIDQFVASPRMNQYEQGVHAPDFKTVKAIAEVLAVPTAYFFCEEDELANIIINWGKK
jgi:transcriptional regulator with XRE-family HTH domain